MRRAARIAVAALLALAGCARATGPCSTCCPGTPDRPIARVLHNEHPMPGTSWNSVPGPIVHVEGGVFGP